MKRRREPEVRSEACLDATLRDLRALLAEQSDAIRSETVGMVRDFIEMCPFAEVIRNEPNRPRMRLILDEPMRDAS